jgi:hypothetical protein
MLSSSIDLSTLPDDLAAQIRHTIDGYEARHRSKDSWQWVLDHGTDEDILQKARGECLTNTPLVLAEGYPHPVLPVMEVVPYSFTHHPRRPVAMRGARLVRYYNYSLTNNVTANGWAVKVFERALRRTKKTLLDPVEILDFCDEVAARVAEKHPTVSHHFWERCEPKRMRFEPAQRMVLMSGKLVGIPYEQFANVERLYNIVRKTEKLEERLRLVRESRRY